MKTLCILFFSGLFLLACNSNKEKEEDKKKEKTITNKSIVPIIQSKDSAGLKIAHYNTDTLQEKYVFFKTEYDKMKTKKKSVENELLKKQSDLQKFVERNEERAQKGLLSQNQLAELQDKLQKMQQEYAIFEQKKTIEMQNDFEQLASLMSKNIDAYAKEFCELNNIDILLQSGTSSQLDYINPSMNATNEFINYLNQKQANIDKDLK